MWWVCTCAAGERDRHCVDEKPSIQALEKLPNGRALTGDSRDYRRNGTSTLFAALEVATGKVTVAHKKRRTTSSRPIHTVIHVLLVHTAIHVLLDNLNTHKPKNDRWLKRHPNVQFHFTPTRASWLIKSRSGSRSCKENP